MHYTQEQIDRANAVSLEDFLRSQGEELIKSGSEYRWKKHDSLTVCENKWFRHSQSKGGFPVDFVMEFYDKSFPEAVALLLNDTGYSPDRNEPQFRLPARSDSKEAAYRYLSEKRKIAPSLLDVFFKAGDIFEDAAHRNVVFIGRDKDGIPRCAHARGMEDQSRRDVSGSDKSCGFSYRGSGNQLFVFEAPIDLLSFICLYPDKWMQRSYVSLGGVVPNPRLSKVYEGIELCRAEGVDFLLAVGGGSVIDSAKAIGYGVVNDCDVWDFYEGKTAPGACLPIGAVLTIAAAGSEMSKSSVITNEDGWLKKGYKNDLCRCKFAVMNPELTVTLPQYQTMSGCVDILMHTMERYFGEERSMELTDQIVREKKVTTIMVTHNLRYAVEYGNRLLMMHQGSVILDKDSEEKNAISVDDILGVFNEISIECGN